MNEQELLALHQAGRRHRGLLTASKICGCFKCLSVFGHCGTRYRSGDSAMRQVTNHFDNDSV
jgi:hypothetical protein